MIQILGTLKLLSYEIEKKLQQMEGKSSVKVN